MKEIKNKKEYRECTDVRDDINSVLKELDRINNEYLNSIIDKDILKAWSSIISQSISNYDSNLISAFEGILVPGNIIKTVTGDGISYSEISYYYIKEVKNRHGDYTLISDVIKISQGEFGNGIERSEDEHVSIAELIERLKKQYYTVVKNKAEYEKLLKFSNTIPDLDWTGLFKKEK